MTAQVFSPVSPRDVGTIVTFFVQGSPVPQPRPRAVKGFTGHAKIIEAEGKHKIHSWKDALRGDAMKAMAGRLPVEVVALRLELAFLFRRPKGLTIPKWADRFLLVPTGRDLDNLAKAVQDALNEIVWADDRQVTTLIARKQYVMPHQAPGVRVGVFIDAPEPVPFWP